MLFYKMINFLNSTALIHKGYYFLRINLKSFQVNDLGYKDNIVMKLAKRSSVHSCNLYVM